VGIAGNAQLITLDGKVEPYVYVPLNQRYMARLSLLVKSARGGTIPQVCTLVRELNPNLPVTVAMPMSEVTAIGLIPQRIVAAVAGSLGVVVLLLAAIGIYGVTSYGVNRRTREIGVRMALGADRGTVLRLVLRQGLVLTAIGVAIGLIARRATRVDAMVALRGRLRDPARAAGDEPPCQRRRSADVRRHGAAVHRHRARRQLRPRAPCHTGRSDGRTADRLRAGQGSTCNAQ
jgi:hypothetical protein